MKYLILVVFILFATKGYCQENELVRNTSRFYCKSDSIEFFFKLDYLKKNEIDTLLEVMYSFDTGRGEDEILAFIWNKNEEVKIKIIRGCNEIIETEIYGYSNKNVFTEYFRDSLFNLNHYPESFWSHEYGFLFSIKQNEFLKKGEIPDSTRGNEQLIKKSKRKRKRELILAEKNPLIKWINQIEIQLIKKLKPLIK